MYTTFSKKNMINFLLIKKIIFAQDTAVEIVHLLRSNFVTPYILFQN